MKAYNEMTSKEFGLNIIAEISKKDIALPVTHWTDENTINAVTELFRIAKTNGKRISAVAKAVLKWAKDNYNTDSVQAQGIAYIVFKALENVYTMDSNAIRYNHTRELTNGDRESVKKMLKTVWDDA